MKTKYETEIKLTTLCKVEQKISELKAGRDSAAENVCKEIASVRWSLVKQLKNVPGLEKVFEAYDNYLEKDIALEDYIEGDLLKE